MISSFLQGGLGNQLFQIASILSLAKDNNVNTIFDIESHKIGLQGNNAIKYKDNIYRNLNSGHFNKQNEYLEPYFHYKPLPYINDCLYEGYYQSEKYFKNNSQYIKEIFSIPKEIKNKLTIFLKENNFFNQNFVSLHVRRGDYLMFPNIHPVIDNNYINNSLSYFNLENYCILIFSDDIIWCRQNIKLDNCIYITNDMFEDYEQLYLMSLCKDNIISNSSFSWWGSYLNNNLDKKIIAPKIWFGSGFKNDTTDIYTENMIII